MTSPSKPDDIEGPLYLRNESTGEVTVLRPEGIHINVRFCAECPAWKELTEEKTALIDKRGFCRLLPRYEGTDGLHLCYTGQQFIRRKEARALSEQKVGENE